MKTEAAYQGLVDLGGTFFYKLLIRIISSERRKPDQLNEFIQEENTQIHLLFITTF